MRRGSLRSRRPVVSPLSSIDPVHDGMHHIVIVGLKAKYEIGRNLSRARLRREHYLCHDLAVGTDRIPHRPVVAGTPVHLHPQPIGVICQERTVRGEGARVGYRSARFPQIGRRD